MQLPSTDRKELRLEVLKEAAQLGVNLYEEHKRFVMSIDPQWRADENVMLLLSAIALFTPERSNVVHKDVIKFEQVRDDTYSVIVVERAKRAKPLSTLDEFAPLLLSHKALLRRY